MSNLTLKFHVSHGKLLGVVPLLFNINDTYKSSNHFRFVNFADDTTIFESFNICCDLTCLDVNVTVIMLTLRELPAFCVCT